MQTFYPKYLLFAVVAIVYSTECQAQRKYWHRTKHEISAGVGYANCLTDLGGGSGDGGYIRDLDLNMTRPAAQFGYRVRIADKMALKTTFSYMRVGGDDANSKNEGRRERNLNFSSNIYELKLQFEYYLVEEPEGIYNFSGYRYNGPFRFDYSLYIFGGIAPFYYNPKTEYQGEKYALRELSTEGQGLPGGPDTYGPIALALPLGIGFKYIINRQMSVGFETSVRFTTTDYLDDVSTQYHNNAEIRSERGQVAAALADRRLRDNRGSTGGIRGNPGNNDVYFAGFFSFNYKLISK